MDALLALKKGISRTPIGPSLRLAYARAFTPPRDAAPPPFGPPYGVAGLLSTPTGIGEAARLSLRALEALGETPVSFDVSEIIRTAGSVTVKETDAFEGPGTLVTFLNAPETPKALQAMGRSRLAGKRVVGFWHWELPRVPAIWKGYGAFVHEVLAPSRFVADAIRAVVDRPVRIVAHPVQEPAVAPLDRSAFGLGPKDFVALTVFNIDSGFHRKNPLGTIRAFVEAFGDRPDARLVIKTRVVSGHERERAELRNAAGNHPGIVWLDQTMDARDLAALMRSSDVLVSLHRSEGFGLVPSQAMWLGLPSVATNWSSTTDFLNDENAALVDYRLVPVNDPFGVYTQRDEVWAEPDVGHAASWLRRLADDEPLRKRLGERARTDAARLFSLEAFARAWRGAP